MPGPLAGRRVVARLERRPAGRPDRRRGRRRGGVEAEDHAISRASPPACSSRTWRLTRSSGHAPGRALGPLDERDRVGREERVEQARVLAVHAAEPVEVEVRERAARALVGDADHEGRARHRARDAERAQRAAHERRLAGAQLARDQHDVAGPQLGGELRARALGRLSAGGPHGAAGRGRRRAARRRRARASPRRRPCGGAASARGRLGGRRRRRRGGRRRRGRRLAGRRLRRLRRAPAWPSASAPPATARRRTGPGTARPRRPARGRPTAPRGRTAAPRCMSRGRVIERASVSPATVPLRCRRAGTSWS